MGNEIEYWQLKCQEMNERLQRGEEVDIIKAIYPFVYLKYWLDIEIEKLINVSKENKINYNKLTENGKSSH